MSEVWRPVVGFEGAYEVSDQGRVRSLDRVLPRVGKRGTPYKKLYKGRELRTAQHKGGYRKVNLYRPDGSVWSTCVHIVVARSFLGSCPVGHEVRHLHGVTAGDAVWNLAYGTPTENHEDKKRHGTDAIGERSPTAKLSEAEVHAIRAARGVPQEVLADRYGCTFSNISAIQRRKSWRHV